MGAPCVKAVTEALLKAIRAQAGSRLLLWAAMDKFQEVAMDPETQSMALVYYEAKLKGDDE